MARIKWKQGSRPMRKGSKNSRATSKGSKLRGGRSLKGTALKGLGGKR